MEIADKSFEKTDNYDQTGDAFGNADFGKTNNSQHPGVLADLEKSNQSQGKVESIREMDEQEAESLSQTKNSQINI